LTWPKSDPQLVTGNWQTWQQAIGSRQIQLLANILAHFMWHRPEMFVSAFFFVPVTAVAGSFLVSGTW